MLLSDLFGSFFRCRFLRDCDVFRTFCLKVCVLAGVCQFFDFWRSGPKIGTKMGPMKLHLLLVGKVLGPICANC